MLPTFLLGGAVIVATAIVHGLLTSLILEALRGTRWERVRRGRWTRAAFMAGLVLSLFAAAVVEAGLWAVVYVYGGVIQGLEQSMYFSLVTFTTLGYGDVTLPEYWRLLGSFQAANGIMIFGWSTAIIVHVAQRVYSPSAPAG